MTNKGERPWRSRLKHQEPKEKKDDDRFLISEGLVIAAIPVVGTAIALLFESGFLSFYGISLGFATLDVSHIVRASLWTAAGLGVAFILHLLMHEWNESPSLWRRLIGSSWPYLISPIYLVLLNPSQWWFIPTILILMILGTLFNAWRWGRRNKKPLSVNTLRILELEREQFQTRLSGNKSTLRTLLPFIAILLLCVSTVRVQGKRSAEEREEYWVLKSEPTLALVERYGDSLVFVRFDPSSKHLRKEIVLRKFSDTDAVHLQKQRVGPLTPQPVQEDTSSKDCAKQSPAK